VADETKTPPAAPPGPTSAWYDPLLKFFSSVHVAVIILILLATISIIGTVLQQDDQREDNMRLLAGFFKSPAAAERAYAVSEKIGFFNLYHTWYFYTLLGLLSTSLTVCSLRRWPQTWQIMSRPRVELEETGFKASPNRRTVKLGMPAGTAADAVAGLLKGAGYSLRAGEKDGARFVFGQKGAFSRLGIYFTHFSIIIIFAGGIIGSLAGYKGYMQIDEGEATDQVTLRGSGGRLQLPFKVRCDDFTLENYPGTGRPKSFASKLTVLDGGREAHREKIEVNSPMKYNGVWFYQSSYGDTGRGMKINIRATDPKTGRSQEMQFGNTAVVPLPGTDLRLQVEQIYPDFAMDNEKGVYSRSNQPRNPAVMVKVYRADGLSKETYLFQLRPDIKMVQDLPVDLVFLGYETLQYTGLQVVYDPGVWVIWLGCTLLVLGLYVAFFVSHRRVWIRVREEGGATVVQIAGNANKNREAFTEAFEKLGDRVEALAGARD
jgi:cytochrome c biogenesis protein